MRSYSLAGTRPAWTSRSVPRLTAPNSERTCTSPSLGAATASSRSSARPGPTYQSAFPRISTTLQYKLRVARVAPNLDFAQPRYILETPAETRKAPSMLERSSREEVVIAAPTALPAWRPVLFFLCVGLTMAGLIWLAALALSPGGLTALDIVLLALFALTLPWYVIGFWNATIGLLLMRFARDPVAAVLPVAGRVAGDEPITASTAILLCTRNEPPEAAARMIEETMQGLAACGAGERFHV